MRDVFERQGTLKPFVVNAFHLFVVCILFCFSKVNV